ncbi:MAG: hypothetical protein HYZ17_02770 [Betaproteobacteria bacterium]|nr:hypothetical protein [Betaproteobacteria bacterium]
MRQIALLAALAWSVVFALPASAAQRTFVSTSGSDANTASNCANATPCRGFTAALTVTDPGGEIIALTSGGYGPVTINKSVSIIAPEGIYAGISVFSGSGITIATASVNVVLRGLTINGLGGTYGVNMTNGASLSIENCVVANFPSSGKYGVFVNTPAALRVIGSLFRETHVGLTVANGATADIVESKFLANYGAGLSVTDNYGSGPVVTTANVHRSVAMSGGAGFEAVANFSGNTMRLHVSDSAVGFSTLGINNFSASGTSYATVTNSRFTENGFGLTSYGSSGSTLIATGNTVSKNTTGLYQADSGLLKSTGDNVVEGNGVNVTGTVTPFTKM